MRRSVRLAAPLLVSCAIGVVAIIVLRALGPEEPDSIERPPDYTRAFKALCEVAGHAADGDLRAANGVFLSRAHLALHELAAEASEIDRGAAATLLEAKAAVEAALPLQDPATAGAVSALIDAMTTALETVTDQAPPTCEEPDG